WWSDPVAGTLSGEVTLSTRAHPPLRLAVATEIGGVPLVASTVDVVDGSALVTLRPRGLRAGHLREDLQWSPQNPVLIDAQLELHGAGGVVDRAASYLGARSVSAEGGAFRLNGVPYFVRAVLEQGYWPTSLMTAPSPAAHRDEVELIIRLGFNTARVHQKIEDPRFLYWADRLGLMIWGETAAAYDFSSRAATLAMSEWTAAVLRDRSHPSIVAWVPVNESWGVPDVSRSAQQVQLVQALASLTRALDPTRPVISNDGWEHVDSDIFTIHDYSPDPEVLSRRYGSHEGVCATLDSSGPQGHVLSLSDDLAERVLRRLMPVMVSEFGGISFTGDGTTWGYATVATPEAYRDLLAALFGALTSGGTGGGSVIAGFCFTQLTDTGQEANGLLYGDRTPKLPFEDLRAIITGRTVGEDDFVWPPVTKQSPPSRDSGGLRPGDHPE
ncbi:MAG TPA: glycoside hydrolase family 2 TIM barrel-domain containing protein, partial [Naasia sp.]